MTDRATLAARVRQVRADVSWSTARALCERGAVLVDGVVWTDPATRPPEAASIEIREAGEQGGAERRRERLLVHLDSAVAVLNKPAGLLSVPAGPKDRDTALGRGAAEVRKATALQARPGSPSLRAVQRLDRDTSGLLVFARTVEAQRELQAQLKDREVDRSYLALAHGEVREGTHETFLMEDRGDGLRGSWGRFRAAGPKATPPHDARRAVTHVEVVRRLRGATLVRCRLETGRQHQIRIHLAETGYPLLGETVYIRDFRGAVIPAPRLMLHAAELAFVHPRTGKELRFEVPPPPDFQAVLERLSAKPAR